MILAYYVVFRNITNITKRGLTLSFLNNKISALKLLKYDYIFHLVSVADEEIIY